MEDGRRGSQNGDLRNRQHSCADVRWEREPFSVYDEMVMEMIDSSGNLMVGGLSEEHHIAMLLSTNATMPRCLSVILTSVGSDNLMFVETAAA